MEFFRTGNNDQNYTDVFYSLFNNTEKDWERMLNSIDRPPPGPTLFNYGRAWYKKNILDRCYTVAEHTIVRLTDFYRTPIKTNIAIE